MAGGWNKFHSKILDWRWYTDGNTFRLFFHLIMTASYKDKPWKNIVIKRGQRIASYDTLAEELQLTRKQIRTALNHLKETNEVAHEGARQYSIITVLNYDKYQAKYGEPDMPEDEAGAHEGANERAGQGHTKGTRRAPSTDNTDSTEHTDGTEERECPAPIPSDPIPYQEIADLYNTKCNSLPKIKALTDHRRRSIRARWNMSKADPKGHFLELFTRAGKSEFLAGVNDRAWIADFDWLMKEQNAVKVLEGKYDNTARAPAGLKAAESIPERKGGHVIDGRYRENVEWAKYFEVVEDRDVPDVRGAGAGDPLPRSDGAGDALPEVRGQTGGANTGT